MYVSVKAGVTGVPGGCSWNPSCCGPHRWLRGPGAAGARWGRRGAGLLGLATPCQGARLGGKGQGSNPCRWGLRWPGQRPWTLPWAPLQVEAGLALYTPRRAPAGLGWLCGARSFRGGGDGGPRPARGVCGTSVKAFRNGGECCERWTRRPEQEGRVKKRGRVGGEGREQLRPWPGWCWGICLWRGCGCCWRRHKELTAFSCTAPGLRAAPAGGTEEHEVGRRGWTEAGSAFPACLFVLFHCRNQSLELCSLRVNGIDWKSPQISKLFLPMTPICLYHWIKLNHFGNGFSPSDMENKQVTGSFFLLWWELLFCFCLSGSLLLFIIETLMQRTSRVIKTADQGWRDYSR